MDDINTDRNQLPVGDVMINLWNFGYNMRALSRFEDLIGLLAVPYDDWSSYFQIEAATHRIVMDDTN